MATLRAVTNTGAVPIRAGDVCIQDASVPTGVAQSSAYGQAGVAGVAMEAIAVGGLGHVVTGGVAFVNCAATPSVPIGPVASLMAGPGGLAVAGTTNAFATTRHAAFSSPAAVTLTFTAPIDADVQATLTAALAAQSVALTVPGEFSVSGSPVVGGSGTLAVSKATQAAHTAYLGPNSGSPAVPGFRLITEDDIPHQIAGLASPSPVTITPAGGGTAYGVWVVAVDATGRRSGTAQGYTTDGPVDLTVSTMAVQWGAVAGAATYYVWATTSNVAVAFPGVRPSVDWRLWGVVTAPTTTATIGGAVPPVALPPVGPDGADWAVGGRVRAQFLSAGLLPPMTRFSLTGTTAVGHLLPDTYSYRITALDPAGNESLPTAPLSYTVPGGSNGRITVQADAIPGCMVYRVYRRGAVAPEAYFTRTLTTLPTGAVVLYQDNGDDELTLGSPPTSAGAAALAVGPFDDGATIWPAAVLMQGICRIQSAGGDPYVLRVTNTDASGTGNQGMLVSVSVGGATATLMQFQDFGASVVGSITHNGTTTAYNTTSDKRLKHRFGRPRVGLAALRQAAPQRYQWKANGQESAAGWIAQDVATVYPEAVTVNADGLHMIDNGRMSALVAAALLEHVEMQAAEIAALQARLARLEGP